MAPVHGRDTGPQPDNSILQCHPSAKMLFQGCISNPCHSVVVLEPEPVFQLNAVVCTVVLTVSVTEKCETCETQFYDICDICDSYDVINCDISNYCETFSDADENEVKEVFKTFEQYYYHTSLQINYDKTTIYRIGSLQKSKAKIYTCEELKNVKCTSNNINILGVDVCHEELIDRNYNKLDLLEKGQTVLKKLGE